MHFFASRRIYIHPTLPVFILLSFFSPAFRIYRLSLLFSALHESFHALGAVFSGVHIYRLSLNPYGCALHVAESDARRGALIAAFGPMGSLLLFLLCILTECADAAKINFLLFAFNLLPALPLDGGRLLRFFLLGRIGTYYVHQRMRRIGVITALCLFITSPLLPSLSCGFIGLLLLIYKPQSEAAPFSAHKKAVPVLRHRIFCVEPEDSLLRLCRRFSPFYYAYFFLSDAGLLFSEADVIRILSRDVSATASSLLPPALPPCTGAHAAVSPE